MSDSLREIDALIAKNVMGWVLSGAGYWLKPGVNGVLCFEDDWSPTTDIAQAFEVLKASDWVCWEVFWTRSEQKFYCDIAGGDAILGPAYTASAPTIPEAICRAVIAALGLEVKGE